MRFGGNAASTSTLSPACFHQHHAHGPTHPPNPDPDRPTPSAWPWGFPERLPLSPPLLSHLRRPVGRPPARVQVRVHTSTTRAQCRRVLRSPRGPRPGRTWSPISGPQETRLVGGQARGTAGALAAMRSEAGERRTTRHVARPVGDCPAATPAPTTATGRKEGEARQPSGGSRRQQSTGAGGSPRMRCRDAGLCACGDGGEGERLPRPATRAEDRPTGSGTEGSSRGGGGGGAEGAKALGWASQAKRAAGGWSVHGSGLGWAGVQGGGEPCWGRRGRGARAKPASSGLR